MPPPRWRTAGAGRGARRPGRVQVLTVHAARAWEWQIVAVPHPEFPWCSRRRLPNAPGSPTPPNCPPLLRGDRAGRDTGGGLHGCRCWTPGRSNDRKALGTSSTATAAGSLARSIDEERRLLYVALTRAEDALLLSGHHWVPPSPPARAVGLPLRDPRCDQESGCGEIEHWEPDPADGEPNPLRDNVTEARWPVDPLEGRRPKSSAALGWSSRLSAAVATGTRRPPRSRTTRTAGSPTSTPCSPNGPAPPSPRRSTCRPSCRSARWWNSTATAGPRCGGHPLAARPAGPARPAGHRLPRLGAAVLRRRAALRPRRPAPAPGDPQNADAEQLAKLRDAFQRLTVGGEPRSTSRCRFGLVLGDTVVRSRIDAVFQ